jgi:hypothetical protein
MGERAFSFERELCQDMARFYADPVGWARYAFRWGEGELAGFPWLDTWQERYLADLALDIELRGFDGVAPVDPIQHATASGHGIGKSALVAIVILFLMSTRPFCRGVVTANTAVQLRTKTWAELAKWKRRCITGHWFEVNTSLQALSLHHRQHPETWRCDGQTAREENSEAFAGLHAATSTPFYIFDEASAIPGRIFEVAQGGLTDGEPWFLMFGNPTRNNGFLYDAIWGKQRHRWVGRSIDSRTARMPNHRLLARWIEDYGLDSDFVKVRVLGKPPSSASLQFMKADAVRAALAREPGVQDFQPVVIGVDVARFGDDRSVIYTRQGRDAQSWRPEILRGLSTMQLAARVSEYVQSLGGRGRVNAVFIDGVGVGGGVVDRCRQLNVPNVIEVNNGARANSPRYANKRAECYGLLREWLDGASLFRDPEARGEDYDLEAELVAIEYGFTADNRILLEPKEDLKDRLGFSPDLADALALTFAEPVGPLETRHPIGGNNAHDYDPLSSH